MRTPGPMGRSSFAEIWSSTATAKTGGSRWWDNSQTWRSGRRLRWRHPSSASAGCTSFGWRPKWSLSVSRSPRQLAGRSEAQPLLAALLNLTPAYYQCLANLGEDAPFDVRHRADVVGMGGLPGSCYMWRTDGALHQLRTEQRQQSRHEPEKVTS